MDFAIISYNVFIIYYPYCPDGTYLTGLTDSCTTISKCLQTVDFKFHKKTLLIQHFNLFTSSQSVRKLVPDH